jgi:hypothetical protein
VCSSHERDLFSSPERAAFRRRYELPWRHVGANARVAFRPWMGSRLGRLHFVTQDDSTALPPTPTLHALHDALGGWS